jgi:hypothetical protein
MRNHWDRPRGRIPGCFRASLLPTSPALIGRPHDPRGIYHEELLKRRCDGGPPAELLPNSDDPRSWRDCAARVFAQVSPHALIGRQGARQSFWDATFLATRRKQPERQANGVLARAPLRVWCRWRCQRQPQDRSSRCPERLVACATQQRSLSSLPSKEVKKSRGKLDCAY